MKILLLFLLYFVSLDTQTNPYMMGAVAPATGACLETDVFTNTNGTAITAHDANWYLAVTGASMEIQSNQIEPLGGDEHAAGQSECAWTNNQYAEVTVVSSGASGTIGAAVRVGGATNGDYYGYYIGSGAGTIHQLFIMNGGSWTEIASDIIPPANGSVIRLEISGTSLQGFDDGSTTLGPETNSTHTTGDPGIAAWQTTSNIGDNWEGGDL